MPTRRRARRVSLAVPLLALPGGAEPCPRRSRHRRQRSMGRVARRPWLGRDERLVAGRCGGNTRSGQSRQGGATIDRVTGGAGGAGSPVALGLPDAARARQSREPRS